VRQQTQRQEKISKLGFGFCSCGKKLDHQNSLAKALGIPQNRLSDIINGKRGVSADTDLRLCRYFGLTDGYFSGLQMDFERIAAKRKLQKDLLKIIPLKAAML